DYQARLFASGHLYESVAGYVPALRDKFLVWHEGKSFTKYAPGFPLLLSLGELARVPGLVNPLLSAASLLLVYRLGASLSSPRQGWFAAALMAASPYMAGYSAYYFAQPASLTSAVLVFWLARCWTLE